MAFPTRRQFLGSTAAAAVAAPLLAGCSTDNSGADEGPVALSFAWWGSASRHEMTEEAIAAFTAKHPDITVEGLPSEFGGYFDRLATQTAAKDAPDVMTFGGAYVAEYAGRESLLDLSTVSEELPLHEWMDEGAINNGQVGDTLYAATTGVNAQAVILNPAVFEDADVDLPDGESWTWEEFAQIARQISENTEDGVFGSSAGFDHNTIDLWTRQNGESLYTVDGELGLTRETLTALFEFHRSMIEDGSAPPAAVISELDGVPTEQTLIATNRAGMQVTWSSSVAALSGAAGQALELVPVPGEASPGTWLQSSMYFSISADSEHPKEAATLINFLLTDPEAGLITKTDRGVPANAAIREVISGELTEAAQVEVDYIARLGERALEPLTIGPTGSTTVADISKRMFTEVSFDRMTPAEAAEQWFTEAEQAIG